MEILLTNTLPLYYFKSMSSLVAKAPVKIKKRVSFAHDEPELLMKPKPASCRIRCKQCRFNRIYKNIL